MLRAQVLVRKLRSHKLCDAAKTKKRKRNGQMVFFFAITTTTNWAAYNSRNFVPSQSWRLEVPNQSVSTDEGYEKELVPGLSVGF